MDTWLYVFIAFIALLSLILCLNVRIIICYEGDKLVYYARILVFKLKIDLNKKKKSRQNESDDKSIVDQLLGVRKSLVKSLGGFMKKLHFRLVKFNVSIGGENATQTALLYGTVTPIISLILEFLDTVSTVNISKNADISVTTDYLSQKSSFEGKLIIRLNIVRYLHWRYVLLKKSPEPKGAEA